MIIFIALLAIIILIGILFLSSISQLIEEGFEFEEGSIIWYASILVFYLCDCLSRESKNRIIKTN